MTVLGDSDSKSRSEEKTKEVILLVIREMKSKEIERIYRKNISNIPNLSIESN